MRLRIALVFIMAGILLMVAAGRAAARCVTPCVPGQHCVQMCQEIPELF